MSINCHAALLEKVNVYNLTSLAKVETSCLTKESF